MPPEGRAAIEEQGASCSHTARAFRGARELLITIRASPNEQNRGAEPHLAPSPALPAPLDVLGGVSRFFMAFLPLHGDANC